MTYERSFYLDNVFIFFGPKTFALVAQPLGQPWTFVTFL
jgi:hypothetical protein